jgi:Fibronectin type III domain
MAQSVFPSSSGISSGNTAGRPSSATVGTTYYNGEIGQFEIFTGTEWRALGAIPLTPTLGTAVNVPGRSIGNGAIDIPVTAATVGGLPAVYTATSSPGGITGTSSTSPIRVSGLTTSTAYTFTVVANNNYGFAPVTAASNSVTVLCVPNAPTIGTVSKGNLQATVEFTAPVANGGSAITNYIVTSSPGNLTASGATSPINVTGLTNGVSYTFTVQAVNAQGTSAASAASAAIVPSPSGAVVLTGATQSAATAGYYYAPFNGSGTFQVTTNPVTVDYMVVAGGGNSTSSIYGAGAGGMRNFTTTLSPGSYTITVGGAQSASSAFGTNTSAGGGGAVGANGGSGAGRGNGGGAVAPGNIGGYTPVEGQAGGPAGSQTGAGGGGRAGSGGGGSNASGDNSSSGGGGAGQQWLNGSYYAGGGGSSNTGGGTSGGIGGGGNGGGTNFGNGNAGTPNTGGGGGGGASGGSGIVIVRYPVVAVS